MKKIFAILLAGMMMLGVLAGCQDHNGTDEPSGNDSGTNFDASTEITVVSREASSGTRGAFDELMEINVDDTDLLFEEAVIVDSTDAVVSKVEVDPYAIGYTSLGSVTDAVKAIDVDGVAASIENVKNGSYGIARPFMLATNGEAAGLAGDFIAYVLSADGQQVVNDNGYIEAVDDGAAYTSAGLTGTLTLSGSTSVEKVIEKLKEAYIALNPGVEIEIIYSGSGSGITDAIEGRNDIAMSSRGLKEEELATLTEYQFASDGIAVVVSNGNPLTGLSSEQITSVFTGQTRTWDALTAE